MSKYKNINLNPTRFVYLDPELNNPEEYNQNFNINKDFGGINVINYKNQKLEKISENNRGEIIFANIIANSIFNHEFYLENILESNSIIECNLRKIENSNLSFLPKEYMLLLDYEDLPKIFHLGIEHLKKGKKIFDDDLDDKIFLEAIKYKFSEIPHIDSPISFYIQDYNTLKSDFENNLNIRNNKDLFLKTDFYDIFPHSKYDTKGNKIYKKGILNVDDNCNLSLKLRIFDE